MVECLNSKYGLQGFITPKTFPSPILLVGDKASQDMHFRHSSYGRQRHAFPPFLLWETKACISAIPPMGDKDMHFRHSHWVTKPHKTAPS